ncbi:MAG: hypothetical protein Kow002_04050 [Anaerolineales bacterium]
MSERKALTRAERVRQRRRNAPPPKAPKKKTASKNASRRNLPPVTARGVVNEYALERHKKQNRRMFNQSTGFVMPRLRAHSVSLPSFELGWRALSLMLVILLGVVLYLLWTLPHFRVSSASTTFVGNVRIPADELTAMLGLNGQPVFTLLPGQVEGQTLLNNRELASVELTVSLPNQVTVTVTERQPLIKWQQGDGYTWIDAGGVAFRPRGEAEGLILVQAVDTPPAPFMLDASVPTPFISVEMVNAIQVLASVVPAGTPITYEQADGLGWRDPRGWKVELGKPQDIALKLRVYEILSAWLEQRGIRPVLINVAYPKTPYYRLEP